MNCRGNAILATLLFVAAGTESFAQTVTWTAGRTLRIDFVMPAAAWPLAPNTLATYGGYATIVQPHTRMTGVLYNGATVMGVSQSVYSNVRPGLYSFYPLGPSFKSPGSPYNFPRDGEPAVVDFTPIWNKTIQGRLEYTIDTGNIQINLGSVALALSESAGPNYGQSIYPSPQILSVKMLPEVPTDPPPPPPVVPGPPMMSGDDDIFMTPSVLKSWCESTKGTAILVRTNLTVKGSSTTPVQIASGCTLDLAAGVTVLFDSAAVNFSGPVNIQSRARGAFKLLKSLVSAPVCTVDLRGAGSEILFAESTLRATAGPLAVAMGDEAKFEIGKVFSGQTDALSATDKLTVAAGRKFVAGLLGVNVRGNAGIHFNLTGDEVSLKSLDGNTFSAAQGSIQINGSGSKSLLEIADTQLLFGQSFGITLSGNENTIKLNKSTIGPSSGTASAGITISAGTLDDNGKVEASEVTLRRARFATIGASRSHGSGLLKWEKGTASIAGNLSFEGSGFTEVKDSSITSPGTIRIANTTGGSCSGASNSLSAQVLQICPPF